MGGSSLSPDKSSPRLRPDGGGNDGVFQEGVKVCRWGADGEGHGLDADGPADLRARGGSEARPASGLRVIAVATCSLAMLRPGPPRRPVPALLNTTGESSGRLSLAAAGARMVLCLFGPDSPRRPCQGENWVPPTTASLLA